MFSSCRLISLVFAVLLISSCNTQYPQSCPASTPVGLLDADEIASDNSLPFRFPLDESTVDSEFFFGWFGVSNECPPGMKDCYEYPVLLFHAAEDYKRPAGTPVYAMADGRISFSGTADGYGWLIIIDHPQANLYSLYGHLSPSRWKQESGTDVKRGDLIAYLGDPDENGGSKESPLEPHLHFGIRAGQTADYPSKGERRFMAGWIRLCPQDIGWMQPSLVITSIYTLGSAGMIVFAVRKKLWFFLIFPGILVTAAGIVLHNNRILDTYVLLAIGILILATGIFLHIRQSKELKKHERPSQ